MSELLTLLQQGLALVPRPFEALGAQLGMSEKEVLDSLRRLKEERMVRRISPIYDTRALGYDSSLVAFVARPDRLQEAAQIINQHPGVSHNYERSHRFNLWFTLAVPPDSRLGVGGTVAALVHATDAQDHIVLRSRRVFKIGVKLDPEAESLAREEGGAARVAETAPLSPADREIIRVTQRDLAITAAPFAEHAWELGMSEAALLERLLEFQEKGLMRRLAAILHHRRAGYKANGMTVWNVPSRKVGECGRIIASFRAVTHCYERTVSPGWPYNLFAMVHGKSRAEVDVVVCQIVTETGLALPEILYSTREFKKKRLEYFTPAFSEWEELAGL